MATKQRGKVKKRQPINTDRMVKVEPLTENQKKIFKVDDNIGIGIAGLVADARVIAKYMRTECINHRFVYDAPMQVGRLVLQVADKAQIGTQRAGRRPYGVGVLIVGADQTCAPHPLLP